MIILMVPLVYVVGSGLTRIRSICCIVPCLLLLTPYDYLGLEIIDVLRSVLIIFGFGYILSLTGLLEQFGKLLGISAFTRTKKGTPPRFIPPPSPECWDGVEKLDSSSSDFSALQDDIRERSMQWSAKYGMRLELEEAYKVSEESRQAERFAARVDANGSRRTNVQRLFHGTALENMEKIIDGGFKLPSHAGMFGKGVYFAHTPLKSWRYSAAKGTWRGSRSRYLLVCDVALGNVKKIHRAANAFDPKKQFQRNWLLSAFGARNFDSLEAVSKTDGGSVEVPEYIVFDPAQTAVRFIVKCTECSALQ